MSDGFDWLTADDLLAQFPGFRSRAEAVRFMDRHEARWPDEVRIEAGRRVLKVPMGLGGMRTASFGEGSHR